MAGSTTPKPCEAARATLVLPGLPLPAAAHGGLPAARPWATAGDGADAPGPGDGAHPGMAPDAVPYWGGLGAPTCQFL